MIAILMAVLVIINGIDLKKVEEAPDPLMGSAKRPELFENAGLELMMQEDINDAKYGFNNGRNRQLCKGGGGAAYPHASDDELGNNLSYNCLKILKSSGTFAKRVHFCNVSLTTSCQ